MASPNADSGPEWIAPNTWGKPLARTDPRATWLAAELEDHPGVTINFDGMSAFTLAGVIQLALRHPEVTGHIADQMRDLVERIAEGLGPGVALVIEAGWDPANDVGPEDRRPPAADWLPALASALEGLADGQGDEVGRLLSAAAAELRRR
jgi:hypothetical protein